MQEETVSPSPTLAAIAMLLAIPAAIAQVNLGEVLDAGGAKLSPAEFKRDVVGRSISGTTPSATRLELMYIDDGRIVGAGFASVLGGAVGGGQTFAINGAWNVDDSQRICTRTRVDLPPQCQFWFKRGEQLFLSDSDWDRQTKVVRRELGR
jgi:hypothetical protein